MADTPQKPPEKQPEEPAISPEDRDRFLHPTNLAAAGQFVQGEVWKDFKRVLETRKPESARVDDLPHVAAAKGYVGNTWTDLIKLIERLPFDQPPAAAVPIIPAELTDPKD